jgi:hypothetical protein
MDSPQQYIERLEFACREQIAEITRLRAENQRLVDWINGDLDAHTVLASVYTDPAAPQGNRVKAAAAALPFERGKVLSVPPPIQLVELVPLKELYEMRKARQERLQGQVLDLLPVVPSSNSNGSGD